MTNGALLKLAQGQFGANWGDANPIDENGHKPTLWWGVGCMCC